MGVTLRRLPLICLLFWNVRVWHKGTGLVEETKKNKRRKIIIMSLFIYWRQSIKDELNSKDFYLTFSFAFHINLISFDRTMKRGKGEAKDEKEYEEKIKAKIAKRGKIIENFVSISVLSVTFVRPHLRSHRCPRSC